MTWLYWLDGIFLAAEIDEDVDVPESPDANAQSESDVGPRSPERNA